MTSLVASSQGRPVRESMPRPIIVHTSPPEQAGMRLKHKPLQPNWSPLYAAHAVRIESWKKFVSEAYWNVELAK